MKHSYWPEYSRRSENCPKNDGRNFSKILLVALNLQYFNNQIYPMRRSDEAISENIILKVEVTVTRFLRYYTLPQTIPHEYGNSYEHPIYVRM